MKRIFFILLSLLSQTLFAQQVVTLSVKQPLEFGFSISRFDTSIVQGNAVVLGTDLVVYGGSGEYSYNWSPGGTLNDSTIINPFATPLDTTLYLLTVTDKYGCSFSVGYTVNTKNKSVGVEFGLVTQTLTAVLFPNPNNGEFKVKLSGKPADKINLTIYDNASKVIQTQTIENFVGEHTEFFQLNLVNGVYTLQIDSGTETLSRQFIIN